MNGTLRWAFSGTVLVAGLALAAHGLPAPAEAAEPGPTSPGQELPAGVTAEMVEQGSELYAGAALCLTCHGAAGAGTPVGPALNDGEWLGVDGSYESLVEVITEGVTEPVQYGAVMLPRGGSGISDEEVEAVAAYVWTLSHGG